MACSFCAAPLLNVLVLVLGWAGGSVGDADAGLAVGWDGMVMPLRTSVPKTSFQESLPVVGAGTKDALAEAMYRWTFTRVILQTTQVTMVGDDEDEDGGQYSHKG